ncbi:MAG: hypothetical protein GY951_13590 [Psychromonas sp.]|nr:hypothetical protein [Psychromonas sp.]
MEFNKASLEVIATVFGTTVEELSGASSNENEANPKLTLNGGRVITQAEEAKLKTDLTDAGIEIGYKKLAKHAKIDLQGNKTAESVMDKLTLSVTSSLEEKYKNMTPTEELLTMGAKVKELEGQLETSQATNNTHIEEINTHKAKYVNLQDEIATGKRNAEITKLFNKDSTQSVGDSLIIYNSTFTEKTEDGVVKIYRGDNMVMKPDGQPAERKDVISAFENEKKWVKTSGMGGDNTNMGGKTKGLDWDQAKAYLAEKNIDIMSTDGLKQMAELTSPE